MSGLGRGCVACSVGKNIFQQTLSKDADFGEAIFQIFLGYSLVGVGLVFPLVLTDFLTGATYSLSPKTLDVVLTPAGVNPRTEIVEIDEAQLRDVKWLRIRAAGPRHRD